MDCERKRGSIIETIPIKKRRRRKWSIRLYEVYFHHIEKRRSEKEELEKY